MVCGLFRFTQIYGEVQRLGTRMEETAARILKIDHDNDRLTERLLHQQNILMEHLKIPLD